MVAVAVHFQDFNAEVLQCLTIPHVNAYTQQMAISPVKLSSEAELSYFAGVWGDIQCIVPLTDANDTSEGQTMNGTACYDIILMAETVYSMSALPGLYKLIEKVPNYS
ncbi:unnamed protein product [Cuscuta epithymum]|uniref:Uncharacterized protein n=1 Tax=Cuscuta epithymum TaxID=186058 RepID=A0AAV0FCG1_9ASTE|nr:unnamed protein product [Cuscuta epithymum]